MKSTFIALIAMLATLMPSSASAFVWCTGPVNMVRIDTNGYLSANWGYGDIMLCNVNVDTTMPAPQGAFSFKACQSVYTLALTARNSGRDFWVSLPNEATCAGFTANANFVGNKWMGHFQAN